jgi:HK97 family phage major capsid protein
MTTEQITEAAEALKARQEEILSQVEAGTKDASEAKALVEAMKPELDKLHAERVAAEQAEEMKALKSEFSTLASVIEDLRKPSAGFTLGTGEGDEGKALDESDPYAAGNLSVFQDIRQANKGDGAARDRLIQGIEGLNAEGKAMTEGVQAQGGYLVRPLVERRLVEAIESDNILRALCSTLNVTTNAIQLDQLGLTTTAGWVAELAQKPESTGMTLATITANVFTAAGLATISNQLLADSNPAVDGLVVADLAKRLRAVEEQAFLAGTGTNQPLGILNTPGIGGTALTATDILSLLDAVLDAIASVETLHGAPTGILMHPRTWTRILKSRDAQGAFYIDPTGGPQDPRTGVRGPSKNLWGVPVYTTNRMPVNLGTGTNESRVVVGDFKEALILDRQGITVDESPHVYFTTNQTVFRAEKRVGFTAARTPSAFNVVGGAGLANG